MKKNIIMILSVLVVTTALFWLGNLGTPSPGSISGNGNPAILFMGILLVLFFFLVYMWKRIIDALQLTRTTKLIVIAANIAHFMLGIMYQRSAFLAYRQVIANAYEKEFGFVDWVYIDQITSFWSLSIHLNNQYFNLNTFLMFCSLSILLALFMNLISNWNPSVNTLKGNDQLGHTKM